MSSSFSVYVGPFLRVPTLQVPETAHKYICGAGCNGKNAKKIDENTAFCPDCAASIVDVPTTKQVVKVPRDYDLGAAFEDWTFTPESCFSNAARKVGSKVVWMPNKNGFGTSYSSSDGDQEAGGIEHPEDERDQAMTSFIEQYAPLIDAAEKHFGVKIDICYGVVPYSH